jgi:hypothetical protein
VGWDRCGLAPIRAPTPLETVASAADRLEEVLLEIDNDPALFHDDLAKEANFER